MSVPPEAPVYTSKPDHEISRRDLLSRGSRAGAAAAITRWAAPAISTMSLTQIAWHRGSPPPLGFPKLSLDVRVTSFSLTDDASIMEGTLATQNRSKYPVQLIRASLHLQYLQEGKWISVHTRSSSFGLPCLGSSLPENGMCSGPYVSTFQRVPRHIPLRCTVRVWISGWAEPFLHFKRFR